MKKLSALLILVLTLNESCNENPKEVAPIVNTSDSTTVENKVSAPVTSCYAGYSKKDTFKMKVELLDKVVTGTLAYQFYEKDNNKGTLSGIRKGDTLVADYKFMSEGMQSVRQVVFLLKNSTAIEGYGDMEEKNGKMVFKNMASVVFGKGVILKKEDCNY